MKRKIVIAATVIVLLSASGWGVLRLLRGPSGASQLYGGSLEAAVVPEFPRTEAASWANGEPMTIAGARGSPVMIEVWAPG